MRSYTFQTASDVFLQRSNNLSIVTLVGGSGAFALAIASLLRQTLLFERLRQREQNENRILNQQL